MITGETTPAAAKGLPEVVTLTAPEPGPTVAILGGVHGDEYEGVLAAATLARILPADLCRGSVRFAAPAHPSAWAVCNRMGPDDGLNLARVFPGQPEGQPTERVAHLLTENVIRGADLLVDLHSAGAGFEMPLLCGYQGGDDHRGEMSKRCAEAFAARFTWRHDDEPAPGRSLTVAYELGIPAIYAESLGGLSVRAAELQAYLDGVRRVLHLLGMVSSAPLPPMSPVAVRGDGNTDAGLVATAAGYLVVECEVGHRVAAGERLATVIDIDGSHLAHIDAPCDGHVMLLRRDARVGAGDTVCIVAALDPDAGTRSEVSRGDGHR